MKKTLTLFTILALLIGFTLPSVGAQSPTIPFTVVFKSESVPANAKQLIKKLGGKVVYEVPEIGVVQVEATPGFAKKALNEKSISVATPSLTYDLPETKRIELNSTAVSTSDASLFDSFQWDIKRLTNNGETFENYSGSHDVVVGIIDSGIDLNHPDVQENLLPGSKNFVPAGGVYGVDQSETGDLNDVQDRNGHGTHVAGSIAANGAMLGVAPNVGFKAYRVFGAEGGAYSSWIMAAIIAAADDGVDVINMSLGGIYSKGQVYYHDPVTGERIRLGSDVAEWVAYNRVMKYAESKGVLVVTSAGNDAVDTSSPKNVTDIANEKYGELGYEFQGASVYAPSSFSNVVNVSSTGPDDELALYSNYGVGSIDVAAPGGDYRVYLQYLAEGRFEEYLEEELYVNEFAFSSVPVVDYSLNEDGLTTGYEYVEPGYSWYVGTSMAAPKVSAIAALIYNEYEGISPRKAKVLLQQTAEDIGKVGYDKQFGHGLSTVYSVFQQ